MNEYREALNEFESVLSEGLEVVNGGEKTTVYSAKEFFDFDEVAAEESFSQHLDNEGLDQLVSLEDCLNGESLEFVLEQQCYESFVNGQKKQCIKQFHNLNDVSELVEYLDCEHISGDITAEEKAEFLGYLLVWS